MPKRKPAKTSPVSIEGTLLMLDDTTPHVAVPVQAIRDGRVMATTLSDEGGKYRLINLKPGKYELRCQVLDGYVYYGEERAEGRGSRGARGRWGDGEMGRWGDADVLEVEAGKTLENIDFRFAHFKKGVWKNYTTLDGLAHNAVHTIYRDPDGLMWFGTQGGGVSRFDGETFVNFTVEDGLNSNTISTIYRDPDGVMWFGQIGRLSIGGGVSRYDGNQFINLTTEDGLASNVVHAIQGDSDGVLWFGTGKNWYFEKGGMGVSRYDCRPFPSGSPGSPTQDLSRKFVTLTTEDGLADNSVWCIHADPDGVLWFGTGRGVSRYDGNQFTNFTEADGFVNGSVWAIHRDSDGVLWFGTGDIYGDTGHGVFRYDGKTFSNLTTEDGLLDNCVLAIHQDLDGVMWFGTRGGVSRYDARGMGDCVTNSSRGMGDCPHFVNFTTKDGLVNNWVNAIHQDPDGVMWFGTGNLWGNEKGGVSRYDGKGFSNLTTKDGLVSNHTWSVCCDSDGAMWFGTRGGGVSRYDGKGFFNLTTKDGLLSNRVNVIYQDDDGMMWFGTGESGGGKGVVSRYDGKQVVNLTEEDGLLSGGHIDGICRDCDGVLWFGAHNKGGISRYDGRKFSYLTTKDGLVSNEVTVVRRDRDGVMWIGTDEGVSRYDGRGMGDSPHFQNFTREDGLVGGTFLDVAFTPDGSVWFAARWGGVARYDGNQFSNFTTKDGLAHNYVCAICRDRDGGMWFGTDGGGVSLYKEGMWTSLDTRDGLASDSIGSIHQDPEGYLWFATNGGITRYRPSTTPPRVYIVSITADQTYHDLDAIPAFTPQTRVTIEYNSIDFKTAPGKRQYRCRIREIDSDWRKATREKSFDCTLDKPGTYTFEVQAIDRDLNYSDPASLKLEVKADPREERLAELEIDLAEKNRQLEAHVQALQKAKEAAEEAQRAAEAANRAKSAFLANMSHEIRTPMNAILGYAGILRRDGDLRSHQQESVETIQKSGEHLLALINDILDLSRIEAGRIELQENDFDLTALINGLSIMFQLRCEQNGLAWRVEWQEGESEKVGKWESEDSTEGTGTLTPSLPRILVHGDEDKLRQILINLLANAVKFTDSGEVRLRISDVGQTDSLRYYTFEVIDTGVGISPEDQANIFEPFQQGEAGTTKGGTGLGLAIAQKHIEIMGGQLGVDSELDKGSRFFFTVPLKPAIGEIESLSIDAEEQVVHLQEGYSVKALVADDNQENRDILSKILLDIGCEVLLAEDGGQAVEMVREHRPDIVFMDIRMPVMNGLEAAQQIWTFFGRTSLRIVAVSASALKHEQQTYLEAGFDGFIPKPFRFEQICECLEKLLAVEYETDKVEETQPTEEVLDVSLPEELLMRLKSSAELHRVTELESHLPELEELGAEGVRLAERLRGLIRNYDMKAILNILSEMQ